MAKTKGKADSEPEEGGLELFEDFDSLILEEDGDLLLDLDQVPEYEAVPQGMYPAVISGARIEPIIDGPNAGKPKLTLTFTVSAEPYVGRKLFRNYSLLPQSLWAIKRLMSAAGLEPIGKVKASELPEMLVGSPVAVSVTHRTYRGEVRANVQNVFSITSLETDAGADISKIFGAAGN